jgi:hypothetical protein
MVTEKWMQRLRRLWNNSVIIMGVVVVAVRIFYSQLELSNEASKLPCIHSKHILQSDMVISFFYAHVYFLIPMTAALQLKQERHEENLLSTMYSLDRHLCQQMEETLGTNKMMTHEFQLHI